MSVRSKISTGLERTIARGYANAKGLSGALGPLDDISKLEDVARGPGLRRLRRVHERSVRAMHGGVLVALAARDMLLTVNGSIARPNFEQVETLQGLAAMSTAKAQKKITKVQAKEAKHDVAIQKKIAKYTAAGKSDKVAKVLAKETKHDAAIQKKLAKYGGVLSAAAAAALAAQSVTPTVATPADTAAAILAAASGLPLTPGVLATAQDAMNAGGGGSSGGGASFAPPTDASAPDEAQAEPAGMLDGIPSWALAAGGLGVLLLVFRGRK